ncbi:pilus assembly PilX family protein [Pseudoalteromonas sp. T1lg22]|uniref:pilus assembly PilX family protein n=1 Tax=Pseudoalteromonas sp. T1lg22 TaxID=2077096 RepID=UPI000CF647E0|nr:PilX N-terminal domain-containing pilus assembly protein [Pseudoalteromonas sp. T1lg22]
MVNSTLGRTHQQGVVLIAALVMVLVVSGVAVTLMSSSSVDMKVINAAQDYDEALTQAYADSSRAIFDEIKVNSAVNFTKPNLAPFPIDGIKPKDEVITLTAKDATASLSLLKAPGVPSATNCSRKKSAHATGAQIKCSRDLRVVSEVNYGKNNRHLVSVIAGIEQESL